MPNIELKQRLNGGMDLDSSFATMPKNRYASALNLTHDALDPNEDNDLTNIVSNVLVPYNYPSVGNIINLTPVNERGIILIFRYSPTGYHGIYEFSRETRLITKIFECLTDSATDILNFTNDDKITSVDFFPRGNGEGDLIFFLDSLGRPTELDRSRFKAGEYTPVTRAIIDVCKAPPLSPPSAIYINDTSRRASNTVNKLFRFKYRYVYDTNEKSTPSPISGIPYPKNILLDTYTNVITNNNRIDLVLNSGAKDVKAVEVLMSYVNKTNDWSDFALVESVLKSSLGFKSNTTLTVGGSATAVTIQFSGYIIAGTVINIYVRTLPLPGTQTLVATYTTVGGDTISSINAALVVSLLAIGIGFSPTTFGDTLYFQFNNTTYGFDQVQITSPNSNNDNIDFPYSFYNDGVYAPINVKESIQLFDYVPDKAQCQALFNGNVLGYAGITDGYDKNVTPNVVNQVLTVSAGNGSAIGNLAATTTLLVTLFGGAIVYGSVFSGIPAIGTVVTLNITDGTPQVASTYTTIAGDTPTSVVLRLFANMNYTHIHNPAVASVSFLEFTTDSGWAFSSLTIVPPITLATANSIPTFLFSTERRIGIAYFDAKGKTNGVLYSAKITFPAYSETGVSPNISVLIPYINSKIYHQPPDWAVSYCWYLTKENTQYIYWENFTVIGDGSHFYFDVTNFDINADKTPATRSVLNYSFKEGDRMRLIRRISDDHVFSDAFDAAIEGLVEDPVISGTPQTGMKFIKIKNVAPFTGVVSTPQRYIIQLYNPDQQKAGGTTENETYYEFGAHRPILDPGTSLRRHAGMVTDQVYATNTPAEFNFYNGDAYFRLRKIHIDDGNEITYYCLDRNFVDIYQSAVNNISGRPNIIDVNAKRSFYGAMGRFGQAYQPDTNINGLNRFYYDNLFEVNAAYGSMQRMIARNKKINVYQQFRVGQIPLYNEIVKDATGKNTLVVSDKLVNPIHYYNGDFGIGDNATSLVSHNFADYFTTNIQGVICRLSEDGIIMLSVLYMVNSFATEQLPLRTGKYHVYGAFDQRVSNYIIALEKTNTEDDYTLVFDENSNTFESFLSYKPEAMTCLGTLFASAKGGNLYTHDGDTYNEFYGVKYPSRIGVLFNENNSIRKKFNALSYKSKNNKRWYAPSIQTNTVSDQTGKKQESSLIAKDFTLEETTLTAALLRDKNSMSDARLALVEGDYLGGNNILINLEISAADANDLVSLVEPYLSYQISQVNF